MKPHNKSAAYQVQMRKSRKVAENRGENDSVHGQTLEEKLKRTWIPQPSFKLKQSVWGLGKLK